MVITIVGIGLIGGSLAIEIRKTGFASKILGIEKSEGHAKKALELGLVDEVLDLEEGIKQAELVIVSTPVDVSVRMLPKIMDLVTNQVVTDMGSTKKAAINSVKTHPKRMQFVASHPMAGTEFSGPEAAIPDLFKGKAAVLCNTDDSSPYAADMVHKLYENLGMRILFMDADDHDMHAAYVSHISHVASYGLALTVLDKEKDEQRIFDLASSGFSSTVRLAKSSADMWTPIFMQNKDHVLPVLETFIKKMQMFKEYLEKEDEYGLTGLIYESNKIKRILKKR